jgi:predicted alpha-1,6-mannanase (GH76 family)
MDASYNPRWTATSAEAARTLFDNLERVWLEDRHDLIAECMADVYVRHDGTGTRRLTPEEYAQELIAAKQYRPNTRVRVYEHDITDDRAWFRFGLMWTDAVTGAPRSRAALQLWRIEQGKLAESWLTLLGLGTAWPDETWQEHWTTKR